MLPIKVQLYTQCPLLIEVRKLGREGDDLVNFRSSRLDYGY